ncbi:MAG TPA: aminomethyltransferase family protein [Candidatus Methylomirabilis sp.]|nr:aminomethyltransferase family protein [Candidatus Methylomirabilis sp.]
MPNHLMLEELHRSAGARLEEWGGWIAPAQYADAVAEYRAVRERAGAIDRSFVGKVAVTGRDRQAFLQGMLSNEIKSLAPGQGTSAAFLDAHGKVMAILDVYVLEDRLLLELPPGSTDKTLQLLDKFLISEKAEFEAADESFAVIAVEGPQSAPALSSLSGRSLDLAPFHHAEVSIAGAPVRVIRRSETGGPGFQCWTAAVHAPALWSALVGVGATPVGTRALNVLRVEAGIPWYGIDVDESVILPETRLEGLVSYHKGCYIGQEVVARVKYRGHVNRALSGLVLQGSRVPDPGAAVIAEGRPVGRITSAVSSVALGCPIALGYVRREFFAPGTAVAVEDARGALEAHVAELPFVTPS